MCLNTAFFYKKLHEYNKAEELYKLSAEYFEKLYGVHAK